MGENAGVKGRSEAKPPNVPAILAGVVVGSAIATFPVVVLSCYMLYLVFPRLPIFLWIALSPFFYVVAKWSFNIILLRVVKALIRPMEEGDHEMDFGNANFRNWLINTSLFTLVVSFWGMFPLGQAGLAHYMMKTLGAKLGKGAAASLITDPPLLEMGDGSYAGWGAVIASHLMDGRRLSLRRVRVGRGVMIGGYTLVFPGAEIGDGALIGAMSLVPKDTKIPPRTVWVGIPARQIGVIDENGNIVIYKKGDEERFAGF
ncbi:MAG: hypothetical protein KIH01_01295 [Candidatus Freyarchaeota archaeon]|nr:hypothetical protein [Candidatus Jordarchaeia archaeon]